MKIKKIFLLLHFCASICDALQVENALITTSDSPVLMKILQLVDAATSDEHLFDVTLKLLKSLCVCMKETLKRKEKAIFNGETNSLQLEDDTYSTEAKVLELYKNIFNKTCFNLRHDIAYKVNQLHNTSTDNHSGGISNCGVDKDVTAEVLTHIDKKYSNMFQDSRSKLVYIIYKTLILTRNLHIYSIKREKLYSKPQASITSQPKHSIIVLITLYPNETESGNYTTSITDNELNTTLFNKSPIDITIFDTKYDIKSKGSEEYLLKGNITECNLESLYTFLIENENRNLTKSFRLIRKNKTIKIYIETITARNHMDYVNMCCNDTNKGSPCANHFTTNIDETEDFNIFKTLKQTSSNTKINERYKDTISKIKKLVEIYEKELNSPDLNIDSPLQQSKLNTEKDKYATSDMISVIKDLLSNKNISSARGHLKTSFNPKYFDVFNTTKTKSVKKIYAYSNNTKVNSKSNYSKEIWMNVILKDYIFTAKPTDSQNSYKVYKETSKSQIRTKPEIILDTRKEKHSILNNTIKRIPYFNNTYTTKIHERLKNVTTAYPLDNKNINRETSHLSKKRNSSENLKEQEEITRNNKLSSGKDIQDVIETTIPQNLSIINKNLIDSNEKLKNTIIAVNKTKVDKKSIIEETDGKNIFSLENSHVFPTKNDENNDFDSSITLDLFSTEKSTVESLLSTKMPSLKIKEHENLFHTLNLTTIVNHKNNSKDLLKINSTNTRPFNKERILTMDINIEDSINTYTTPTDASTFHERDSRIHEIIDIMLPFLQTEHFDNLSKTNEAAIKQNNFSGVDLNKRSKNVTNTVTVSTTSTKIYESSKPIILQSKTEASANVKKYQESESQEKSETGQLVTKISNKYTSKNDLLMSHFNSSYASFDNYNSLKRSSIINIKGDTFGSRETDKQTTEFLNTTVDMTHVMDTKSTQELFDVTKSHRDVLQLPHTELQKGGLITNTAYLNTTSKIPPSKGNIVGSDEKFTEVKQYSNIQNLVTKGTIFITESKEITKLEHQTKILRENNILKNNSTTENTAPTSTMKLVRLQSNSSANHLKGVTTYKMQLLIPTTEPTTIFTNPKPLKFSLATRSTVTSANKTKNTLGYFLSSSEAVKLRTYGENKLLFTKMYKNDFGNESVGIINNYLTTFKETPCLVLNKIQASTNTPSYILKSTVKQQKNREEIFSETSFEIANTGISTVPNVAEETFILKPDYMIGTEKEGYKSYNKNKIETNSDLNKDALKSMIKPEMAIKKEPGYSSEKDLKSTISTFIKKSKTTTFFAIASHPKFNCNENNNLISKTRFPWRGKSKIVDVKSTNEYKIESDIPTTETTTKTMKKEKLRAISMKTPQNDLDNKDTDFKNAFDRASSITFNKKQASIDMVHDILKVNIKEQTNFEGKQFVYLNDEKSNIRITPVSYATEENLTPRNDYLPSTQPFIASIKNKIHADLNNGSLKSIGATGMPPEHSSKKLKNNVSSFIIKEKSVSKNKTSSWLKDQTIVKNTRVEYSKSSKPFSSSQLDFPNNVLVDHKNISTIAIAGNPQIFRSKKNNNLINITRFPMQLKTKNIGLEYLNKYQMELLIPTTEHTTKTMTVLTLPGLLKFTKFPQNYNNFELSRNYLTTAGKPTDSTLNYNKIPITEFIPYNNIILKTTINQLNFQKQLTNLIGKKSNTLNTNMQNIFPTTESLTGYRVKNGKKTHNETNKKISHAFLKALKEFDGTTKPIFSRDLRESVIKFTANNQSTNVNFKSAESLYNTQLKISSILTKSTNSIEKDSKGVTKMIRPIIQFPQKTTKYESNFSFNNKTKTENVNESISLLFNQIFSLPYQNLPIANHQARANSHLNISNVALVKYVDLKKEILLDSNGKKQSFTTRSIMSDKIKTRETKIASQEQMKFLISTSTPQDSATTADKPQIEKKINKIQKKYKNRIAQMLSSKQVLQTNSINEPLVVGDDSNYKISKQLNRNSHELPLAAISLPSKQFNTAEFMLLAPKRITEPMYRGYTNKEISTTVFYNELPALFGANSERTSSIFLDFDKATLPYRSHFEKYSMANDKNIKYGLPVAENVNLVGAKVSNTTIKQSTLFTTPITYRTTKKNSGNYTKLDKSIIKPDLLSDNLSTKKDFFRENKEILSTSFKNLTTEPFIDRSENLRSIEKIIGDNKIPPYHTITSRNQEKYSTLDGKNTTRSITLLTKINEDNVFKIKNARRGDSLGTTLKLDTWKGFKHLSEKIKLSHTTHDADIRKEHLNSSNLSNNTYNYIDIQKTLLLPLYDSSSSTKSAILKSTEKEILIVATNNNTINHFDSESQGSDYIHLTSRPFITASSNLNTYTDIRNETRKSNLKIVKDRSGTVSSIKRLKLKQKLNNTSWNGTLKLVIKNESNSIKHMTDLKQIDVYVNSTKLFRDKEESKGNSTRTGYSLTKANDIKSTANKILEFTTKYSDEIEALWQTHKKENNTFQKINTNGPERGHESIKNNELLSLESLQKRVTLSANTFLMEPNAGNLGSNSFSKSKKLINSTYVIGKTKVIVVLPRNINYSSTLRSNKGDIEKIPVTKDINSKRMFNELLTPITNNLQLFSKEIKFISQKSNLEPKAHNTTVPTFKISSTVLSSLQQISITNFEQKILSSTESSYFKSHYRPDSTNQLSKNKSLHITYQDVINADVTKIPITITDFISPLNSSKANLRKSEAINSEVNNLVPILKINTTDPNIIVINNKTSTNNLLKRKIQIYNAMMHFNNSFDKHNKVTKDEETSITSRTKKMKNKDIDKFIQESAKWKHDEDNVESIAQKAFLKETKFIGNNKVPYKTFSTEVVTNYYKKSDDIINVTTSDKYSHLNKINENLSPNRNNIQINNGNHFVTKAETEYNMFPDINEVTDLHLLNVKIIKENTNKSKDAIGKPNLLSYEKIFNISDKDNNNNIHLTTNSNYSINVSSLLVGVTNDSIQKSTKMEGTAETKNIKNIGTFTNNQIHFQNITQKTFTKSYNYLSSHEKISGTYNIEMNNSRNSLRSALKNNLNASYNGLAQINAISPQNIKTTMKPFRSLSVNSKEKLTIYPTYKPQIISKETFPNPSSFISTQKTTVKKYFPILSERSYNNESQSSMTSRKNQNTRYLGNLYHFTLTTPMGIPKTTTYKPITINKDEILEYQINISKKITNEYRNEKPTLTIDLDTVPTVFSKMTKDKYTNISIQNLDINNTDTLSSVANKLNKSLITSTIPAINILKINKMLFDDVEQKTTITSMAKEYSKNMTKLTMRPTVIWPVVISKSDVVKSTKNIESNTVTEHHESKLSTARNINNSTEIENSTQSVSLSDLSKNRQNQKLENIYEKSLLTVQKKTNLNDKKILNKSYDSSSAKMKFEETRHPTTNIHKKKSTQIVYLVPLAVKQKELRELSEETQFKFMASTRSNTKNESSSHSFKHNNNKIYIPKSNIRITENISVNINNRDINDFKQSNIILSQTKLEHTEKNNALNIMQNLSNNYEKINDNIGLKTHLQNSSDFIETAAIPVNITNYNSHLLLLNQTQNAKSTNVVESQTIKFKYLPNTKTDTNTKTTQQRTNITSNVERIKYNELNRLTTEKAKPTTESMLFENYKIGGKEPYNDRLKIINIKNDSYNLNDYTFKHITSNHQNTEIYTQSTSKVLIDTRSGFIDTFEYLNKVTTSRNSHEKFKTKSIYTEGIKQRTVRYNTYKPNTEEDLFEISKENQQSVKEVRALLSKLKHLKEMPLVKNTTTCSLLNNISRFMAQNIDSFIEVLKTSNCTVFKNATAQNKKHTGTQYKKQINILNRLQIKNHTNLQHKMLKVNMKPKVINTKSTKTQIAMKKNSDKLLLEALSKTNLYPIKKVPPKTKRKMVRKIPTKNTDNFLFQNNFMTKNNAVLNTMRSRPKPYLLYKPVTPIPKQIILRPKFENFLSEADSKNSYFRPKPMIIENNRRANRDNFGLLPPIGRRPNLSWQDKLNFVQELLKPSTTKPIQSETILEKPLLLESMSKPKFLRDRINSIRNYVFSADFVKSTSRSVSKDYFLRPPFLDESEDVNYYDPSPVRYLDDWKPATEPSVISTTKRRRRSRRTMFFLSPTVPYNRYF